MYYLVYGLLWLVSLLPFWVLYLKADFIYWILYYVIGYRKEVVLSNLAIAFPEKSEKERIKIAKQFYKNLIDTFIESIKFISISRAAAKKRTQIDAEILKQLAAEGYNIYLLAGHQFTWEYFNLVFPGEVSIPVKAVYAPIANKILDKIFLKWRTKYGMTLYSAKEFTSKMNEALSGRFIMVLAADQNPGVVSKAYWMNFFGKPAPFFQGPAKGAIKTKSAVVMAGMKKIKRGYYRYECTLITKDAGAYTPEQLTVIYKNEVERVIKEDPSNYLWSHRRWRHEWKSEYGPVLD